MFLSWCFPVQPKRLSSIVCWCPQTKSIKKGFIIIGISKHLRYSMTNILFILLSIYNLKQCHHIFNKILWDKETTLSIYEVGRNLYVVNNGCCLIINIFVQQSLEIYLFVNGGRKTWAKWTITDVSAIIPKTKISIDNRDPTKYTTILVYFSSTWPKKSFLVWFKNGASF